MVTNSGFARGVPGAPSPMSFHSTWPSASKKNEDNTHSLGTDLGENTAVSSGNLQIPSLSQHEDPLSPTALLTRSPEPQTAPPVPLNRMLSSILLGVFRLGVIPFSIPQHPSTPVQPITFRLSVTHFITTQTPKPAEQEFFKNNYYSQSMHPLGARLPNLKQIRMAVRCII